MQNYIELAKQAIPVVDEVDVVILGAGPAGFASTLSASRNKLKTILVDKAPCPGGLLLYNSLMGMLDLEGNQIIRGIAGELICKLRELNGVSDFMFSPPGWGISLAITDTEMVKHVVLDMLLAEKVELYLHTFFAPASSEVLIEDKKIKAIVINNKSGRQAVKGKQFIDCSGDGDLVAASGAPFVKGDEISGEVQASTLKFVMENVDIQKLRLALVAHPEIYTPDTKDILHYAKNEYFLVQSMHKLIKKVREEQGLNLPNHCLSIRTLYGKSGQVTIEVTRVNIDATDNKQLTAGEIATRKQIFDYIRFLNGWVPGFENAKLKEILPYIGVRESRRIIGDYILTGEDIKEGRRFFDEITLASNPLDDHGSKETIVRKVDKSPYGIPYRCLIPKKIDNLLVAGRCISTTHEAHSSTRIMAMCMGEGQAVGCAAAMAIEKRTTPREINIKELKTRLREQGAYLPEF